MRDLDTHVGAVIEGQAQAEGMATSSELSPEQKKELITRNLQVKHSYITTYEFVREGDRERTHTHRRF